MSDGIVFDKEVKKTEKQQSWQRFLFLSDTSSIHWCVVSTVSQVGFSEVLADQQWWEVPLLSKTFEELLFHMSFTWVLPPPEAEYFTFYVATFIWKLPLRATLQIQIDNKNIINRYMMIMMYSNIKLDGSCVGKFTSYLAVYWIQIQICNNTAKYTRDMNMS